MRDFHPHPMHGAAWLFIACYLLALILSVIISWTLYSLHLVYLTFAISTSISSILCLFCLFSIFWLTGFSSRPCAFRVQEVNIQRICRPYLRITQQDILEATANFSHQNIIGKGRFGTVYKGILSNGRVVAIKRMKLEYPTSHNHFLSELQILWQLRHRNLLRIFSFFYNEKERIIVSEFIANLSLDVVLQGCRLDWKQRLNVAVGVAHGLSYLHHECRGNTILYCDLKPENILLDKHMEPRIADFGAAQVINDNHITQSSFGPMFTDGYTAPERAYLGRPSPKRDVYSFGIILLELISGVKPTCSSLVNKGLTLSQWAKNACADSSVIDLLDDCLKNEATQFYGEMKRVLRIGVICTDENPVMRPEMKDVVQGLMEIAQGIEQISIPISVLVDEECGVYETATGASMCSIW